MCELVSRAHAHMRTMRRNSPKLHTYTGRLSYDMVGCVVADWPDASGLGNRSGLRNSERMMKTERERKRGTERCWRAQSKYGVCVRFCRDNKTSSCSSVVVINLLNLNNEMY